MMNNEVKDPKKIRIVQVPSIQFAIKKKLIENGLVYVWDIAEFQNTEGCSLTDIAGISSIQLFHIAKVLANETGMIMPKDVENDEWCWPNMKRVLKIFIAQPMSGLSDDEVLYERDLAIKKIYKHFEDKNVILHFLDQYYVDENPPETCKIPSLFYLGHSIQILGKADYIYFVDGWEKTRGCMVEWSVAQAYNIPILELK